MSIVHLTSTITATGEGAGQETLSWTAYSGGGTLDHYEVFRYSFDDSFPDARMILPTKTTTSLVLVRGWSMTPGNYGFYIVAIDATGTLLGASDLKFMTCGKTGGSWTGNTNGGWATSGPGSGHGTYVLGSVDSKWSQADGGGAGTWFVAGVQHGTTPYKQWHNANEASGLFPALPGNFVLDDYSASAPTGYTFSGSYDPEGHPTAAWNFSFIGDGPYFSIIFDGVTWV